MLTRTHHDHVVVVRMMWSGSYTCGGAGAGACMDSMDVGGCFDG